MLNLDENRFCLILANNVHIYEFGGNVEFKMKNVCAPPQGQSKFLCGNCNKQWSIQEVYKMALLTAEEAEYFEMKIFENAAKSFLEVKQVSQTLVQISLSCEKNQDANSAKSP